MERSCFTIDLGAIRRNAEALLSAAGGAELWAVVKAEGTATARSTSRALRSTRARRRSASRRCPKPSTSAPASGTHASSSWGPSPSGRSARRGRPGSSS